jgi:hypothetical protein
MQECTLNSSGSELEPTEGCCGHDNEPLVSKDYYTFLDEEMRFKYSSKTRLDEVGVEN